MKILLISYGNLDYDGRLRSLISVFERMGDVYSFTKGSTKQNKFGEICNSPYSMFVRYSIKFAKKLSEIDILVLDNRKATIPGFLIIKALKPRFIIQDCRELYLLKEVKQFSSKIGCIFEKKMVRKADIVLCANQERSEIMQREYGLPNTPITYENLRLLQYSSDDAIVKAKAKFAPFIFHDEVRIISSSGCSLKRTNDVLVKNLRNVKKKCRLFLVGHSERNEEKIIRDIASTDQANKVTILGQLNQTELKYLISQCQIGIVNYGQYDTNNRFCASGKLYEFIYEGIPVVTTTNPPLKRLCDSEKIGVADDNYSDGINKVLSEYSVFKNNVDRFSKEHTIDRNDKHLVNTILEIIGLQSNNLFMKNA